MDNYTRNRIPDMSVKLVVNVKTRLIFNAFSSLLERHTFRFVPSEEHRRRHRNVTQNANAFRYCGANFTWQICCIRNASRRSGKTRKRSCFGNDFDSVAAKE